MSTATGATSGDREPPDYFSQSAEWEDTQPLPPDQYHWIPVTSVEPGMVCARPVSGILGSRAFTLYQTDTKLTENTILQMFAKGVECVAVYTDEASAVAVKDADPFEARLSEIFGEFPTDECRSFMDALRVARPTLG